MTSRNPFKQHSYVPFTGYPYIYYNGVDIRPNDIQRYDNATKYVQHQKQERYPVDRRTILISRDKGYVAGYF